MKKNFSIPQVFILMSLSLTFISSCDHARSEVNNNLNIDYKITGSNQIWIDNSIGKVNKSYYLIADNVITENNILNNPSLVKLIKWSDSTTSHQAINNKDSIVDQLIIKTSLETDTLYLNVEAPEIKEYIVSGKTQTKAMTVSSESDSLRYVIKGTFNATIQIKNKRNEHAEKMAYFISHKILYERIHQNIIKGVEQIASR